jgi:hypothetical protein
VDLNHDGYADYLAATFNGSPNVAYGSEAGLSAPVQLKDRNGQRIIIASLWDYEKRSHEVDGRAFGTEKPPSERCVSALAFDWDADGDHDLLLGSYENGHLYRQMNEGSDKEPQFTGKLIPVMAGDKPFAIPAKMTTPRLVDWDGDGDLDLIAGSFGDAHGTQGTSGGVYLSLNGGSKGKPAFGPLQPLIAPGPKGGAKPTRPHAGLYADAADYDGDGDLDLVVGGYSMWTPHARELSAEEKARVAELRKKEADLQARQRAHWQKVSKEVAAATEGMDRRSPEARKKSSEIYAKYRSVNTALGKERRDLMQKLNALVPSAQRRGFVWIYERLDIRRM